MEGFYGLLELQGLWPSKPPLAVSPPSGRVRVHELQLPLTVAESPLNISVEEVAVIE